MTQSATFKLGVWGIGQDKKEVFSATYSCNLLSFRMVTRRGDDGSRPTTQANADILEMTLGYTEMPDKLVAWYLGNMFQNGIIETEALLPDSLNKTMRIIRFYDAQCFSMDETYQQDKTLRQLTIKIAMGRMVVDNQEFKRA